MSSTVATELIMVYAPHSITLWLEVQQLFVSRMRLCTAKIAAYGLKIN